MILLKDTLTAKDTVHNRTVILVQDAMIPNLFQITQEHQETIITQCINSAKATLLLDNRLVFTTGYNIKV